MVPQIDDKLLEQVDRFLSSQYRARGDWVLSFSEKLFLELYGEYKEGTIVGRRKSLLYFFINAHSNRDRYQDIMPRLTWAQALEDHLGEELNFTLFLATALGQGLPHVNTWKGRPLYKTVTDQSILNMLLHEHRPRTIIEIGTGNGSSAEYMGDMMSIYGYDCNIVTFDFLNKNRTTGNTQFVNADCNDLNSFNVVDYSTLPHPWLVVEDAHANVGPVLKYFTDKMIDGDMMIVEDSGIKQEELKTLPLTFKVDTKYTDYFGFNFTSSINSIFKVIE